MSLFNPFQARVTVLLAVESARDAQGLSGGVGARQIPQGKAPDSWRLRDPALGLPCLSPLILEHMGSCKRRGSRGSHQAPHQVQAHLQDPLAQGCFIVGGQLLETPEGSQIR